MICKYCGSQINDGEKYCSACGMKVEQLTEKQVDISLNDQQGFQANVQTNVQANNVNSSADTCALVSLILSIVGILCCGCFAAIPALITGIIGLKSNTRKGFAIAGIIISSILLLISIIAIVFYVITFLKYGSEYFSQFMDPEFFNEFSNYTEFNT